jgi:acyl-CoA synthetase (AMP-forming)/AMP-acid ligase II
LHAAGGAQRRLHVKTVGELIRWRALQHAQRPAIVHGDRQVSYARLDQAASQVANALLASGVQAGERVCVLDKGHDQVFEVLFGAAKGGAVFTPVNWRLAAPEIAYVVNDSCASVLFVGADFSDAVQSIEGDLQNVRTIVRFGSGPASWVRYESWRDAHPDSDPHRDTDEHDPAWQLYTSGTTGHPKGAEITHHNLFNVASVGVLGFGGLAPGDVGLVCMPLYHIGGAGYALCLVFAGMTLVLTREFEPTQILRLMQERKVNHAFFVPAMLNFLLQHPDCAATDFTSLRGILYGASPIPEDLLRAAIERFRCSFVQAYGLTETTGAISLLSPEDHLRGGALLRSCGRPIFGCAVRVVDDSGRDCAPNDVGEIIVRGDAVMKGYWNQPQATAEAIRDGWFHSGDVGCFDESGHLYIRDRVKDMIVSGGENVYPAEVESVLFSHPAVADVAVIGVPDERWGEAVKAVVVVASEATVTEEEILEFCRGRIAGYKRPKSVDFTDTLPRNPTGKILKRELRARYWTGQQRQVH